MSSICARQVTDPMGEINVPDILVLVSSVTGNWDHVPGVEDVEEGAVELTGGSGLLEVMRTGCSVASSDRQP